MSPFATTRVIHPLWAEHHRAVVAGTLTGTCTISGPGTAGTWTPTGGPGTPAVPSPIHAGPCRVQATANQPRTADAADQDVTTPLYLVVIDRDAPMIPVGSVVHIDTSPDDPTFAGMDLTVRSESHGTLTWERDLTCTLDLSNQSLPT